MADNTTLASASGGDTIRTEDRTTFKTPVSLIDVGGTSAEAIIGDSGVAMPVKGLGTAGTANAAVVTVQGIASMTPFQIADNSGSLTVDAPVATPVFVRLSDGSAAISTLAVSLASVPSHAVTNAGTFAVQSTSTQSGTWTVELGATDNAVLDAIAASVAGTLTVGSHAVTNAGTFAVQATCTNAGTFAVQAAQSGTWNIGTVTTLTSITNAVAVTDNSGTLTVDAPVGTPVFVRLSDGSAAITTLAVSLASVPSHAVTNAGTFAVQATCTNAGTFAVQETAATSGGTSVTSAIGSLVADEIKGSAGQVYSIDIFNINATPVYVRIYNQIGDPGTGDTANIIWRGIVPGSTAGGGLAKVFPAGLVCSTGIGVRITGAIADNDATAITANTIIFNITWK